MGNHRIHHSLDTTIWKLDPLRVTSYHKLAMWLKNTKCIINVKNQDQKCFKYAILAGLYTPTSNSTRPASYRQFEENADAPNFNMLKYPVILKDIERFERHNNVFVNVYGVKDGVKGRKFSITYLYTYKQMKIYVRGKISP